MAPGVLSKFSLVPPGVLQLVIYLLACSTVRIAAVAEGHVKGQGIWIPLSFKMPRLERTFRQAATERRSYVTISAIRRVIDCPFFRSGRNENRKIRCVDSRRMRALVSVNLFLAY